MGKKNQPDIFWYSALTLSVIGAFNWGLIGLIDFNAVQYFFGDQALPTKLIYISIGVSSLYFILKAIQSLMEEE